MIVIFIISRNKHIIKEKFLITFLEFCNSCELRYITNKCKESNVKYKEIRIHDC